MCVDVWHDAMGGISFRHKAANDSGQYNRNS